MNLGQLIYQNQKVAYQEGFFKELITEVRYKFISEI
ncbi:hypothetical protein IGI80_001299 [Enterococcus sp. DIV1420a]